MRAEEHLMSIIAWIVVGLVSGAVAGAMLLLIVYRSIFGARLRV
jgi:uncharacterized membrane protein YeaQ/YmgE (transglycosylase-associated protein family)